MYKVVAIDDERMILEGLKILLDWELYNFTIVGMFDNVTDGLRAIDDLKPDILITDIRMPEKTGLELIEYIQENIEQDIEIIIMSGYEMFSYAQTAMQFGVSYYLVKPIFEEDLLPILKGLALKIDAKRRLEAISIFDTDDYARECLLSAIHGTQKVNLREKLIQCIQEIELVKRWCYIQVEIKALSIDYDTQVNKNSLSDQIKLVLINHKMTFLLDVDKNSYGIIVGMENEKMLEDFMQKLYAHLENSNQYGLYLSVGSVVKDINDIKESYVGAIQAMNYKVFNERSSIIYYEEINSKLSLKNYEKLKSIHKLLEIIEISDHETIEGYINELFLTFQNDYASYEIVKLLTIQLIYLSLGVIQQMNGSTDEFLKAFSIERLEFEHNKTSIHDLRKFIITFCKHFNTFINTLRIKQKHSDYIAIEDYIKVNYQRNITIKELANHFYMHPVYLGQMLNKRWGISFNDYLHRLRIEESIKQFPDENIKLNKLAEDVGYHSYYSYLKHFEKFKGMKPNVYRELYYKV